MSLTLNMVGGGGGGLSDTDALLRVQAPAGSTVTITKSTVTMTGSGHENAIDTTMYDYYFIIHQSQFDSENPWTVEATLGSQTKTQTIIIDAADEYDVLITYRLYLCNTGQWDTTVAGTLTAVASKVDGSSSGGVARAPSITYASEYINVEETTSGDWYGGLAYGYTQIDITGYTVAKIYGNAWGNIKRFCIWNNRPTNPSTSYRVAYVDMNGINTYTIDLTNLTGSLFYFGVYVCKAQYSSAGISIYDMYLDN